MASHGPQLVEFKEAHKQLDKDRRKILDVFASVLDTLENGFWDSDRRPGWVQSWKELERKFTQLWQKSQRNASVLASNLEFSRDKLFNMIRDSTRSFDDKCIVLKAFDQGVLRGREEAESIKREFDELATAIENFPKTVKLSVLTTLFTRVSRLCGKASKAIIRVAGWAGAMIHAIWPLIADQLQGQASGGPISLNIAIELQRQYRNPDPPVHPELEDAASPTAHKPNAFCGTSGRQSQKPHRGIARAILRDEVNELAMCIRGFECYWQEVAALSTELSEALKRAPTLMEGSSDLQAMAIEDVATRMLPVVAALRAYAAGQPAEPVNIMVGAA